MGSTMTRWCRVAAFAWITVVAALSGAGVLIDGLSPRAASAQGDVFVTNYLGDSVTVYSRAAAGNVSHTFTLSVPAPVLASETLLVSQIRRNLAVYAGQNPGHPVQAVYVAEAEPEWAADRATKLVQLERRLRNGRRAAGCRDHRAVRVAERIEIVGGIKSVSA